MCASTGAATAKPIRPLWVIVMARMSADKATRAYVERRVAEGRSKLEVIRVLKRYVARELYRYLPRA